MARLPLAELAAMAELANEVAELAKLTYNCGMKDAKDRAAVAAQPPSFRTAIHVAGPSRSPKEPPHFETTHAETPLAFGRRVDATDRTYVVSPSGQLLRSGSGWRAARRIRRIRDGEARGQARVEAAILEREQRQLAREKSRAARKEAQPRG